MKNTKELNESTRLLVLNKMKELLDGELRGSLSVGLCYTYHLACSRLSLLPTSLIAAFPKSRYFKKTGIGDCGYWFDPSRIDVRIMVVDKLIEIEKGLYKPTLRERLRLFYHNLFSRD